MKGTIIFCTRFPRLLLSIHKNSDSIIQEIMKSFEFIKTKAGKGKDLKWGTWGYELVFKYKDLLIQSNFVLHGIEEFRYMEENYVRLHTYFICWTSNNFKKCTWNVCTDSSDGNQFYSPLYFIVWMGQGDIAAHCSKVNMKICIYSSCPGKMKLALIGSWCKPTRSLGTNGLF